MSGTRDPFGRGLLAGLGLWLGVGVASACPICGTSSPHAGVGLGGGFGVGLEVLPDAAETETEPEAPPSIEPSPAVTRLLEGPVLDDNAKLRVRVFHGRWDELDENELSPALLAELRAMRGQVSPELAEQSDAAAYHSAYAALRLGAWSDAVALAERLPDQGVPADATSRAIPAEAVALLRARVAEANADFDAAAALLRPIRERFLLANQRGLMIDRSGGGADPATLVAAADAIVLLATLEGRPASDYRRAVSLFETALDLDPLYWPAKASLAALLAGKDNPAEARDLVLEALALNPHAAEAWETLGHLMIDRWDFVAAQQVIDELQARTPDHPAIDTLTVRRALYAADLDTALLAVTRARVARPDAPELMAWDAAVAARRLDPDAAARKLAEHDAVTNAHPFGAFTVGDVLSNARRYDDARPYLETAAARQPNDAKPRLALGLMLMQLGDLPAAREHLADAARLDPFHAGVDNSLQLVDDLLDWPTIESENFLVRFTPGPDAALAADLAGVMERHRVELAAAFGQATDNTTQIDLLPDSETFAVRVTGQSELGALAACTGDVLAMAPPRLGAAQTGVYHWSNVMRHEYVHAIVFDLSNHLAPRWFHEGLATHFEELDRSFDTQQMLAAALHRGELIPFDELAAAFGTPRIGLAYQQSAWMVQYIVETRGGAALLDMLSAYAAAGDDADALLAGTGQEPDAFTEAFLAWAEAQTQAWGLIPPAEGEKTTEPGRLRTAAEAALQTEADAEDEAIDPAATDAALLAYAEARPGDPWPRRQLAARALRSGDEDRALEHLRWLDRRDLRDARWATSLTQLLRERGDHAAAYAAAQSALHREPYNATFRETAATLALLAGDLAAAEHQITALVALEPDVEQHQRRLDAIRTKRNAG